MRSLLGKANRAELTRERPARPSIAEICDAQTGFFRLCVRSCNSGRSTPKLFRNSWRIAVKFGPKVGRLLHSDSPKDGV